MSASIYSTSATQSQPTNNIHQPKVLSTTGDAWRQIDTGCWARECTGTEQGISYNQNVRDGHTELTVEVPFNINVSTLELVQRVRNAWLICHADYPEIAIQLSTGEEIPQMMKYQTLQSDVDASAWLQETLHIFSDRSIRDVVNMTYSRRLPTKGKRSMLYLVTASGANSDEPSQHCLVWNVGHVVADAYSIMQFLNHLFKTITKVTGDYDLKVSQLDYARVFGRLPISAVTSYEKQYKPTQEQRKQAMDDVIKQGELCASKIPQSIAMYPEADSASREHKTHCIRLQYTPAESQALLARLRDEKLSITFAAAAATLLAVKQTYAKGHETGALLGMTRNAQRWIDPRSERENGGSVPNATDVVFLWIEFEEHWFQGSTRDAILFIGRAIKKELGPHLKSPHYISSLNFTSERAIAGLAAEKEPIAAPCAPGFSSQGALALEREFTSGGTSITAHDFIHTGRQINASPWVGMFSLWGRVTLSMGFDSRYYEPTKTEAFVALAKANLVSLTLSSSQRELQSKL